MKDLIVIGGGPAGITAGIYSARQRLNVLLITKDFGGQMVGKSVEIENYPGFGKISSLELIRKFENHLKSQKIDIEKDEVAKLEKNNDSFLILTKAGKRFEAKAVIIASGADPRPLEIPGEKEFIGRGVSYCVNCDGPLFCGKTVVVIGGGNTGFEAAIFLEKIAKKIFILEYGPKVKADEINQERIKKIKKAEIITEAVLKEIKGDKFVNSIIYQDKKSGKEINLSVDGVFVEIGVQPATSFIKNLVDFNERDEIVADPRTGETKTPGLFAAGDVDCVPYKQIVVAAGEGAKAAISAFNYLSK